MKPNDLCNMFLDHIILDNHYVIIKKKTEDGLAISLMSKGGAVDIEFCKDIIYATLDNGDIYHVWEIFPNNKDMINAANKLKQLIG